MHVYNATTLWRYREHEVMSNEHVFCKYTCSSSRRLVGDLFLHYLKYKRQYYEVFFFVLFYRYIRTFEDLLFVCAWQVNYLRFCIKLGMFVTVLGLFVHRYNVIFWQFWHTRLKMCLTKFSLLEKEILLVWIITRI